MTIHPEQLLAARIPRIEQRYGSRDCIVYALGIGVGLDPMDEADLPFVDETRLGEAAASGGAFAFLNRKIIGPSVRQISASQRNCST